MPLKDQLVSLELSRELRDLGVRAESYFIHRSDGNGTWHPMTQEDRDYDMAHGCLPAYSVAELGTILWEMLEENGWGLFWKAYG